MPSVSSHGHAPASPKTIDVRANLLEEWIVQRRRTEDRFRRYFITSIVLIASSIGIVPGLIGLGKAAYAKQAAEQKVAVSIANRAKALEDEGQLKDPQAVRQKMLAKSSQKLREFCDAMAGALNAAPEGVVLSRLRGEMLSGELDITGEADAVDEAAARGTVNRLSAVSDVNAALLTASKPSPNLAKSGVQFEFLARRQLNP
jgi:hypothetical protein